MRRVPSVMLALAVALAAFAAQSVVVPGRVFACSCISPPDSLAEFAARPDVAIVAGTVGRALPDRTPIAVESWFHGPSPTDVVWLIGGTNMMTSCDIFMSAGERRLLVLQAGDGSLYSTNICLPGGVIGTPEGDALLADATAAFGSGVAPPSAEPEAPAPIDIAPWLGGLGWVAALVAVALALFGVLALVARRRPSG